MVRKTGGTRKKAHHRVSGVKHKTHRRRRRVSGMGDISGMAEKAGGLVIGAVAARELNTLASKFVTLSPLMSGVLQMAVGLALPKFVKGAFFQNMGDGMIANGGMVAIVATGVITGNGGGRYGAYQISGTANLPVINGTANLPVINGSPTRIANSFAPQGGNTRPIKYRFNPMVPY
jgi:hypothetical protein